METQTPGPRPLRLIRYFIVATFALPVSPLADTLAKLWEVKEADVSSLSIVPLFSDGPQQPSHADNALPSSAFVTASRDSRKRLRLSNWTVNAAGQAHPTAVHTTDGTIKAVAATETQHCGREAAGCFVTAVRDSGDRLRVIQWFVEPGGATITRGGTAVGPRVREVAASSIAGQWAFITARDFDGNLRINNYAVGLSGDDPVVVQLPGQEWTFGKASGITATPAHDQAVSMRDSDGRLRVIQLRFPEGTHTIDRAGTGTGGEVSSVRIAGNRTRAASEGEAFTFSAGGGPVGVHTGPGCRGPGRLLVDHGMGKIIGWRLLEEGRRGELTRTREKELEDFGGIAKKGDLLFLRGGQNRLITAHLGFGSFCRLLRKDQGKPRLQLNVWDTGSRSDAFIKVADTTLGGDYTELALTEIAASGNQRRFAVALRGVRGELKITVWGLTP